MDCFVDSAGDEACTGSSISTERHPLVVNSVSPLVQVAQNRRLIIPEYDSDRRQGGRWIPWRYGDNDESEHLEIWKLVLLTALYLSVAHELVPILG